MFPPKLKSKILYELFSNIGNTYTYIADYIYFNGVSVAEINANTDTTGWTFEMFPSTADDKYKVPVILFVNAEHFEVRIHEAYYYSLTERLYVTIAEGLVLVNGNVENTVTSDISYTRKSSQWLDLNEEYTVTYYVNGEVYAEEKYTLDDTIVMLPAPDYDANGYTFSGWDKTITRIGDGDEEIKGYITIIQYSITYDVKDGENSPQNPIRYTIESGKIVLEDGTEKENFFFAGWYDPEGNLVTEIPEGSYGDISLTAKYRSIRRVGCKSEAQSGIFGLMALTLLAAAFGISRFAKKEEK